MSNIKSTFNAERAEEITTLVQDLKTHKVYYCKKCGKVISRGAYYCADCYTHETRKVERPSREVLKELIRSTPFTTIAQNFGVSDNAVRKWCTNLNLPSRKTDIKNYSDEEWELI